MLLRTFEGKKVNHVFFLQTLPDKWRSSQKFKEQMRNKGHGSRWGVRFYQNAAFSRRKMLAMLQKSAGNSFFFFWKNAQCFTQHLNMQLLRTRVFGSCVTEFDLEKHRSRALELSHRMRRTDAHRQYPRTSLMRLLRSQHRGLKLNVQKQSITSNFIHKWGHQLNYTSCLTTIQSRFQQHVHVCSAVIPFSLLWKDPWDWQILLREKRREKDQKIIQISCIVS